MTVVLSLYRPEADGHSGEPFDGIEVIGIHKDQAEVDAVIDKMEAEAKDRYGPEVPKHWKWLVEPIRPAITTRSIPERLAKLGAVDGERIVENFNEGDLVGVRAFVLSLAAGRAHQAVGAADLDSRLAQLISEDVMDLTALALEINPLVEGRIA